MRPLKAVFVQPAFGPSRASTERELAALSDLPERLAAIVNEFIKNDVVGEGVAHTHLDWQPIISQSHPVKVEDDDVARTCLRIIRRNAI